MITFSLPRFSASKHEKNRGWGSPGPTKIRPESLQAYFKKQYSHFRSKGSKQISGIPRVPPLYRSFLAAEGGRKFRSVFWPNSQSKWSKIWGFEVFLVCSPLVSLLWTTGGNKPGKPQVHRFCTICFGNLKNETTNFPAAFGG